MKDRRLDGKAVVSASMRDNWVRDDSGDEEKGTEMTYF